MVEEGINSPAVSRGETIGECKEDSPLGSRGLFIRRGDGGGGGCLPGDGSRGEAEPRPCRCILLRFLVLSLELVVLLNATSDAGDSLRQLPAEMIEDVVKLPSLSLASPSIYIERLLRATGCG